MGIASAVLGKQPFFPFRDDSAKILSAARATMASVAQDLVDEEVRDDLAKVDLVQPLAIEFLVTCISRLRIRRFTADCSSASTREGAQGNTPIAVPQAPFFILTHAACVCGLWRCFSQQGGWNRRSFVCVGRFGSLCA